MAKVDYRLLVLAAALGETGTGRAAEPAVAWITPSALADPALRDVHTVGLILRNDHGPGRVARELVRRSFEGSGRSVKDATLPRDLNASKEVSLLCARLGIDALAVVHTSSVPGGWLAGVDMYRADGGAFDSHSSETHAFMPLVRVPLSSKLSFRFLGNELEPAPTKPEAAAVRIAAERARRDAQFRASPILQKSRGVALILAGGETVHTRQLHADIEALLTATGHEVIVLPPVAQPPTDDMIRAFAATFHVQAVAVLRMGPAPDGKTAPSIEIRDATLAPAGGALEPASAPGADAGVATAPTISEVFPLSPIDDDERLVADATLVIEPQPANSAQNAVYLELLGSGLLWSINYDRRTENNLCLRAGFGYFSWDSTNEPGVFGSRGSLTAFPVTVTKLLGPAGKWLELGLGATFVRFTDSNLTALGLITGSDIRESSTASGFVVHGIIGFRLAPPATDAFIFRVGITPIVGAVGSGTADLGLRFWAGVSFGVAF